MMLKGSPVKDNSKNINDFDKGKKKNFKINKTKRKLDECQESQLKSTEKPDWKKLKLEKKELKAKRKQKSAGGNEVYVISLKAKKIWEEVRREDCKKERKVELCKELYELIKEKVKSLVYAHDTVRVIETLFSAGGEDVRAKLFEELKENILDLCKNKYSRFFVSKILKQGTKQQKDYVINVMMGNVVKLMHHKIACDVLEIAYNDCANAKQRSHMIQEFFGPRFRLFKEEIPNLKTAIEKYPDLKERILSDVNLALQPILTKGVFTNVLMHTLLKEYLYVCSDSEKRNIIDAVREGLLPILHTRDGARVAMLCLWNGTPKDKKLILRSFRGNMVKIALEEYGHMVLLAAFDATDDTVFVSKAVLSELMENLDSLTENENGKKVLRYLVAPRNKLFFHPHVLAVLEEGDKFPNSKKELMLKHRELQNFVAKPILQMIHKNINVLARDSHWTLFIGAALQTLHDDLITGIFQSLAEICAEAYLPGDENHFLEVAFVCKMISYIIQCDKQRYQEDRPIFSTYLVNATESEMKGWCLTNRGCFILIKLLESGIPVIIGRVKEILSSAKSKLKKLEFPGAEILLKKLQ
ncbi:UNVERIFIED_CONTAM: hypothetical protein RMT77_003780 [Armadillidium vulgare]